jgi:type IV secretory pathway TrbL component
MMTVVGTIMSAFFAFRITHSYGAQKMLSYAFSVGIKLMMLNLCIGVVQTLLVPQIQN